MKIDGATLVLSILLLVPCAGCAFQRAHLPSDKKAEAFFRAHRKELADLIVAVERQPKLNFVSAEWVGYGADAADPDHVACAKLLKKVGAQFLRQGDGGIEIYVWGSGCAICHDSYEGYAFITPGASLLKYATPGQSLEDKALPKGKYAPIEDGSYIHPLDGEWYVIRWECG